MPRKLWAIQSDQGRREATKSKPAVPNKPVAALDIDHQKLVDFLEKHEKKIGRFHSVG